MKCMDENNFEVFYHWNGQQLGMLKAGGVLVNPAPAPLSTDQLKECLTRLTSHPNYQGQRVVCNSVDGGVLTMTDGKIEVS